MDTLQPTGFSNELIEFSKLLNETFNHIGKDVKTLTNKSETSIKATKADVDKVKKELADLKSVMNNIKSSIIEIEKNIKKRNSITPDQAKPVKSRDDIKTLMSEIADMKLSIKNIEHKLKMD